MTDFGGGAAFAGGGRLLAAFDGAAFSVFTVDDDGTASVGAADATAAAGKDTEADKGRGATCAG